MNSNAKWGVALALTFSLASAYASQTTTLKVQGKIISAGCNVTLPNGDVGDFGSLTEADFENADEFGTGRVVNKSQQLSVVVACPEKTALAIKASDNNAASRPKTGKLVFSFDTLPGLEPVPLPSYYFGLGLASNGAPIGAYAIKVGNISVDGVEQPAILVGNENNFWQALTGPTLFSEMNPYVTPAASDLTPVAGKTFEFPLDIAVNIANKDTLPGNEAIKIDASSTIEVKYL